jgi:hypothetical protein
MSPDDLNAISLTPEQAYRAMHRFVQDYFERGGKKGDELVLFLSHAAPGKWSASVENPVGSGDPAAWDDWKAAIRGVTSAQR